MQSKPVVKYDASVGATIKVGDWAHVFAIDHPEVGPNQYVTTSRVLAKYSDGSFETRNTIYVPLSGT